MRVYAVEHGEYSDYGIVAIFSTKAAAEAAIESMPSKYGDERVVEWPVLDSVPPPRTIYSKTFQRRSGNVTVHSFVRNGWDVQAPFVGRVTRGLGFGKWDGNYRFWGEDEARVNKAFDDYHAQQRAIAEGIA